MKKQLNETIEITPDWDSMFEHAERIVREEIDKDSGQEFVLEMLEYGQRLQYYHAKLAFTLQWEKNSRLQLFKKVKKLFKKVIK